MQASTRVLNDTSPTTRRTLRAALVAVWAWGSINAVSSPSQPAALPPPPYPRDVVLVVRCPLVGDRVGPPEAVIRLSTAQALGGVEEGLSDLQLDPGGDRFLLLTSHEGIENTRDGHSGHLFRVPAEVLLGAAPPAALPLGAPLRGFSAKPGGLAVEPSGALVVVFDDDREWKQLFAGYEQSDDLFTVIDPRP